MMGCAYGKFVGDSRKRKKMGAHTDITNSINPVFRVDSSECANANARFSGVVGVVPVVDSGDIKTSALTNTAPKVVKADSKFDSVVTSRYEFKKLIGYGSFSRVWMVENRGTKQPYAIKIAKGQEGRDQFDAEIVIVSRLKHPNVIQFVEVFRTTDRTYMVMELATGGDLFDRIESQGPFGERDAVRVLRMVLEGVKYLHASGVTHRDLKLDNLLFYHPGQNSKILIVDFSLASRPDCPTKGTGYMNTICGTPEYMAPEVLAKQPYTCLVDMWALGVIAYTVLSASFPFDDDSNSKRCRLIISGQYSYKHAVWSNVNECAKDFINHLLVLDAASRMTAAQALKHPWMRSQTSLGCGGHGNLQRAISSSSSSSTSSRSSHSGSLSSSRRRRRMKLHELDLLHKDPEWKLLRERILVSMGSQSFNSEQCS